MRTPGRLRQWHYVRGPCSMFAELSFHFNFRGSCSEYTQKAYSIRSDLNMACLLQLGEKFNRKSMVNRKAGRR